MKTTKLLGVFVLLAGLVLGIFAGMRQVTGSEPGADSMVHSEGLPDPVVTPHDAAQIAQLRAAGLRRESAVPVLIAALNNPPHPDYKKTALHSLARLGATDALSAIDNLIKTGDADTANYAEVAKARLITEDAAKSSASTMETAKNVDQFCQELGETPDQINSAVAMHYQSGGGSTGPQTKEVYALREIADMMYTNAKDYGTTCTNPPGFKTTDFLRDQPSFLKVRLAALPPQARLSYLIQDLSQKKALGMNDYFEMQLAADEGLPASRAAAAQLTKMEANKIQFTTEGFVALLQVIHGVGDRTQAPIFARLMAQANVEFMYPDVKNGIPEQIVPGY